MEFFDKLGKKASEAYKITADKTGKIAKETKLKLKMSGLRTQVDDLYEEIGKKVYEEHLREDEEVKGNIKEKLEQLCIKIDVLSDEIEDLLSQCLELRDKKQCKNCYVEMDKEYKYCPNCGAKQENVAEQDESYENVSLFEENESQENNKEEEKTEEQEENKNLEKTVKVESNVEDSDESEEKNNNNDDIETY